MIVNSYCCHCHRCREFTIIENIGPALGADRQAKVQRLFTTDTAPGYEVRGLCSVDHRDANGEPITKNFVIARWKVEAL